MHERKPTLTEAEIVEMALSGDYRIRYEHVRQFSDQTDYLEVYRGEAYVVVKTGERRHVTIAAVEGWEKFVRDGIWRKWIVPPP